MSAPDTRCAECGYSKLDPMHYVVNRGQTGAHPFVPPSPAGEAPRTVPGVVLDQTKGMVPAASPQETVPTHTIRACRGHWHVVCGGDDLAIEGDPFRSEEEAQDAADRLNRGEDIPSLANLMFERMTGIKAPPAASVPTGEPSEPHCERCGLPAIGHDDSPCKWTEADVVRQHLRVARADLSRTRRTLEQREQAMHEAKRQLVNILDTWEGSVEVNFIRAIKNAGAALAFLSPDTDTRKDNG